MFRSFFSIALLIFCTAPIAVAAKQPRVSWPQGIEPSTLPEFQRVDSAPSVVSQILREQGFTSPDSSHWFGSIATARGNAALHLIQPNNPKGTIFLSHGYFDHCGILAPVIERFVAQNWTVACWDQAGHGLTSGKRMWIDSMHAYTHVVRSVESTLENRAPKPWVAVGHSLGGAIFLERARDTVDFPYQSLALMAPMLRYKDWTKIGVALPVLSLWSSGQVRGAVRNSSDSAWIQRVQNDSLEGRWIDYQFLKAVRVWQSDWAKARLAPARWAIFQGELDSTVDWRYSLQQLPLQIPNLQVVRFPKARHHLLNEVPAIRRQIEASMFHFLERP